MSDQLVRVRISGAPVAVAVAADRLRMVLGVAGESADYPCRRDLGVRRYLDILIPSEDLLRQEVQHG